MTRRTELVDELCRLHSVDEGLVGAYGRALWRVDDAAVRQELQRMEQAHRRHLEDVDGLLARHGETTPPPSREAAGLMGSLQHEIDIAGTPQQVVEALDMAELAKSMEYLRALGLDLDDASGEALERHAEDEIRHLQVLGDRIRMRRAAAPRATGVRWGTGGYGTGDQFGGGEGGGAGGFPSAGPSYSGGENDYNTGE